MTTYQDFTISGDWIALHEGWGDAPQRLIRLSDIAECSVAVNPTAAGNAWFEYQLRDRLPQRINFTEPNPESDHYSDYGGVSLAWALVDAILDGKR